MIVDLDSGSYALLSALANPARLEIIRLLAKQPMNVTALAKQLNLSTSITARHVRDMSGVGLIRCESMPGRRGTQKLCSLMEEQITFRLPRVYKNTNTYTYSIPVGLYDQYEVVGRCGLATVDGIIGMMDDARYFDSPERLAAKLIWFEHGSLLYKLPNYIEKHQHLVEIRISFEVCSEYLGYKEDFPSDLYFYLNGVPLGYWTSPGDFGAKRGTYTPPWWSFTQYGLLRTLRVTRHGTFLGTELLSDITIDQLSIVYGQPLSFTLAAPQHCEHPGGLNLFGVGFGNYDQDIVVEYVYEDEDESRATGVQI